LETQTSAAGRRSAGEHHALPGLDVILAVAICLAGLSLRLHGISEPSLWLDEGASWTQARLYFFDMLRVTSCDN
jgi:hypothetical protein